MIFPLSPDHIGDVEFGDSIYNGATVVMKVGVYDDSGDVKNIADLPLAVIVFLVTSLVFVFHTISRTRIMSGM